MDHDRLSHTRTAGLRDDTRSGASDIAGRAAEALRSAAVRLPADSPEELASALERAGVELVRAQPAMAPLLTVAREVVEAARAAPSIDESRRAAARAAELFRTDGDERIERVARSTAKLLPKRGLVATVSSSSTVRSALLRWTGVERGRRGGADGRRRVLCLESRPGNEGRSLAEALAERGVAVTLAVDAAVERLLPGCAALVLGADAIGDRGVVNKIGSAAAARAAAAHGVPVHVLATTAKLLPPGVPQPFEDPRPDAEVWAGAEGVQIWNEYFEIVPSESITSVVTEDGVKSLADLEAQRAELRMPEGLRVGDVPDGPE